MRKNNGLAFTFQIELVWFVNKSPLHLLVHLFSCRRHITQLGYWRFRRPARVSFDDGAEDFEEQFLLIVGRSLQ